MPGVNTQLGAIVESSAYPSELRAKALELLAQAETSDERRRIEETARAETLRLERAKIWLNTPIIAAIAGLLTLGATHIFTLIESSDTADRANKYTRSLEERKFQFEMIKSALSDSKDAKQRAVNLLFLVDSKVLDGLNTEALRKYAEEHGTETPAFESGSGSGARRLGVERENRKPVPQALIADLTNKAREADTLKWMQHAIPELGVAEIPGPDANTRIMENARFVELGYSDFSDDMDWAGLFVNFVLKKAGFDNFPSSPLSARAWSQWGVAVEKPKFGAIAVIWRFSPQSGVGHVGFVVGEDESSISVLGGNQQDSINITKFPKAQLLALRMPPTG